LCRGMVGAFGSVSPSHSLCAGGGAAGRHPRRDRRCRPLGKDAAARPCLMADAPSGSDGRAGVSDSPSWLSGNDQPSLADPLRAFSARPSSAPHVAPRVAPGSSLDTAVGWWERATLAACDVPRAARRVACHLPHPGGKRAGPRSVTLFRANEAMHCIWAGGGKPRPITAKPPSPAESSRTRGPVRFPPG
jgi:hypothetical protein